MALVNYGQYTSTDTGLIYLRARVYDPATAQFLSVDPLAPTTRAPYTYAEDSPLNFGDPTGLWSPTESLEKVSTKIGEGIASVGGGLVNGLTGGLIEGSGNSCSTGYTIGQYGSLLGALLPEDLGPQLFQKFANRFPRAAGLLLNQQAKQQVTQPGKLFILKAALEKLSQLFGG
jgi:RHS repeat-associated protein